MKIPASVTKTATVTVHITHDEARRLPGMLGAMAPHELKARGYYAVTVGGVKTLYVLQVQCAHCNAHVASNAVIVRGGEPCCAKCAKGVRAYSKLHGVR